MAIRQAHHLPAAALHAQHSSTHAAHAAPRLLHIAREFMRYCWVSPSSKLGTGQSGMHVAVVLRGLHLLAC